jgi:hypothetical protein
VRLQIEIRLDWLYHKSKYHSWRRGRRAGFRADDNFHLREMPTKSSTTGSESVSRQSAQFRDREQGFEDVVKKGFSRQRTVVFAGHTLAVVPHGNEGGKFNVRHLTRG